MNEYEENNLNEEEEDEEIITLSTPDGEEVDFTQIAGVDFEGKFYAILQPVELFEGMDDDEALVFSVEENEDGDAKLDVVTDDRIIDGVFAEYNKMYEEKENTDEN